MLFTVKIKHSARFLHFFARQSGMTSTHWKKKSNYLGKSIDSLIAPNEYTLDIFTSPQFFVGLLDSQISANSVSVGRNRHEKIHMIHTTSLKNSIWREDVYSNIFFKIKVVKTFLRSPRKIIPFILHTETEDVNRQFIYDSDCNKAKLQCVGKAVIGCNGSNTLVMMDPYNSLKSYNHKDLVGSGGSFVLVIDTQHGDHFENEETIFGSYQKYCKWYNSRYYFKPHSLYVFHIYFPIFFLCIWNPN